MMQEYIIEQNWSNYSNDEHEMWRTLYRRQETILPGRVVPEFLEGMNHLGVARDAIPKFENLSKVLRQATGWEIVAVPGLVPDEIFFKFLAQRQFPSTCFIRKPHQIDYLQEPDIFHDIFGHVPLLVNPIFADYMEAYGKAGLKALHSGSLHRLARLYWYTVEFGLIQTSEGLRTYGSGIVSSYSETLYCVENSKPNRLLFDLKRVMRTKYRIDDFQETYFVIPSFDVLFHETQQDLLPLYHELNQFKDFEPGEVTNDDVKILI
jgi:phenylalanine-4-hydroxylase